MMTQMLRITTRPLQYELQIERARLEISQNHIPKGQTQIKPAVLDVRTKIGRFEMDTYEARKSLGHANSMDRAKQAADKGMESIKKTTRVYVDIGNAMSRIDEGVTIADIFAQKFMGDQPTMYMAFLPSTGAQISWVPHEITSDFEPAETSFEWEIMRNVMNYVPGSIRMNILEWPSIEVEYIGGRIYFPPSASAKLLGNG